MLGGLSSHKTEISISIYPKSSSIPSTLFDEYSGTGEGSKAVLVDKLAVLSSTPLVPVDLELLDGM